MNEGPHSWMSKRREMIVRKWRQVPTKSLSNVQKHKMNIWESWGKGEKTEKRH